VQRFARQQLAEFCSTLGLDDQAELPSAFRALLPCTAFHHCLAPVDIVHSALRAYGVSLVLWSHFSVIIMSLARGVVPCASLAQTSDFQAAKASWIAACPARAKAARGGHDQTGQARALQVRCSSRCFVTLLVSSSIDAICAVSRGTGQPPAMCQLHDANIDVVILCDRAGVTIH
jgi:hypothetical protein